MDRDAFLGRVRDAALAANVPAPPEVGDWTAATGTPDEMLAAFRSALENVDGIVHSVESEAEVPALVGWIMGAAGVSTVLSWGADRLPVGGIVEHLVEMGVTRVPPLVPADAAMRLTHQQAYADVDAGVTGAQAGFAESGSIVLAAAPGQPRMASLIPPLHVAVLRKVDIYPSLSTWARLHPRAAADTANLVFITGPSRTGDIEMQLNLGVHGPREIHVILC